MLSLHSHVKHFCCPVLLQAVVEVSRLPQGSPYWHSLLLHLIFFLIPQLCYFFFFSSFSATRKHLGQLLSETTETTISTSSFPPDSQIIAAPSFAHHPSKALLYLSCSSLCQLRQEPRYFGTPSVCQCLLSTEWPWQDEL